MTAGTWFRSRVDGSAEEESLEEDDASTVDTVTMCLWDFQVEIPGGS